MTELILLTGEVVAATLSRHHFFNVFGLARFGFNSRVVHHDYSHNSSKIDFERNLGLVNEP